MSATKSTTPGAGTVKVAVNTGAAKNEVFTGVSEDRTSLSLNVLANDPGSARIWSLDQLALKLPSSSALVENLSAWTLASGARISLNADGTVQYHVSAAMQSLAAGDIFNDSFIYTIRMANGALSTATAVVQIVGENDAATFSGDTEANITEDDSNVTGLLVVSDVDHDQSLMLGSLQAGNFGSFSMAASGNWSYTLGTDMNYLAAGESVSENFTVQSLDGTETVITLNVVGVNDAAVFSGDLTASLIEDSLLVTTGVLAVSDADHDQSGFAGTGDLTGTYGDFSFDLTTGAWTYELRNADANVQALNSSDVVQDRLLVSSIDGTSAEILVSITGVDEVVVPPPVADPIDTFNVNRSNIIKLGQGKATSWDANNKAFISDFDSNDVIKLSGLDYVPGSMQIRDVNNDGQAVTSLKLFWQQGQETYTVELALIGFTDFNPATGFDISG